MSALTVLQVLPALNSGGVERGTLDFGRELVARGHKSLVMSTGGGMLAQLEAEGSRHLLLPVARKSLWSLRHVPRIRRVLQELSPDIIHVRSRLPAWLVWLAWKGLPEDERPGLVTTFHGLYSRNAYSAIMGRGERVIAISQTVYQYIQETCPSLPREHLGLVHRGVDTRQFCRGKPSARWWQALYQEYPAMRDKPLVIMPGRLSRWKGQRQFLHMMLHLKSRGVDCHGVLVGDAEAGKGSYLRELHEHVVALGLQEQVSLVGRRNDMCAIYRAAALVCNLSQRPEPFGRTVIEALACGAPVLAVDRGGPAEVLRTCYPQGLVYGDNPADWAAVAAQLLQRQQRFEKALPAEFTLATQAEKTLAIYEELLASKATARVLSHG